MTTYLHRLYDKVVASPVRLRLLPEIDGVPDVSVEWSREVLDVPATDRPLARHRAGTGYLLDAPVAGIVVAIDAEGRRLTVHPKASGLDVADFAQLRPVGVAGAHSVAADILVTNALNTLPVLWNRSAMHAATLSGPTGVVMLCAPTGWGKSTVAQYLGDQGMDILDDDSASIEPTKDGVIVVPLGARARLREDAAARRRVSAEVLPGYPDGKQALHAAPVIGAYDRVAATIHLVQLAPDADRAPLEVTSLDPAHALVSIHRSMYVLDRSDRQALLRRLDAARHLARAPSYAVVYRRGIVGPDQVAQAIADLVTEGDVTLAQPSPLG